MESVITGLVSRFGYWGVLLLIAVENFFRRPQRGDPHLRRLFNDLYGDDAPRVILFSTLGSVAGAIVLYGVGRLLRPQRLEALLSGRGWARAENGERRRAQGVRTGLRPTAGPVCFTAAASPSCAASSPSQRAWRACIRRRFCCSPPWAACCGISCWSIWARWPGKAGLPLRPRWSRPRAG